MTTVLPPGRVTDAASPPAGLPRLLFGLEAPGTPPLTLRRHVDRWGWLPPAHPRRLLAEVEASGLCGHGGAWFPVGRKWRSVAAEHRLRPVVVANGAEGEPASSKDATLLWRAPHLVLDGAVAAAVAVGATDVVVYVHQSQAAVVRAAIDERSRVRVDPVRVAMSPAPERFLAGQESAAVNVINGRDAAAPTFVGIRSVRESGVSGRPTLVQNVETLAHVALIARYGAPWFRSVGTHEAPGSMLLTVHGRWDEPTVVEAALGAPLRAVLDMTGGRGASFAAQEYQGALLGGYGGGFVSMGALSALPLSEQAARDAGSTLGAGVVALIPAGACPVAEVARVVSYLRDQSAGQCGPCVNGLAELSARLQHLAFGRPGGPSGGTRPRPSRRRDVTLPVGEPHVTVARLLDLCDLVDGRGACKHPDGVARFVRSACAVFADHFDGHVAHGACRWAAGPGVLPVPAALRGWRSR
jgi:NADH:ubiquinone oxidoreductase subunit F (NADH-binding)